MENDTSRVPNLSPKVQTGTLGIMSFIVTIAVLILIGFAVYYNLLKARNRSELTSVNTKIQEVNEQIKVLKNKDVEKVFIAQRYLMELEKNQVMWSSFLTRLAEATPVGISYTSFSSQENGDVVVSAMAPSFRAVADLIVDFGKNQYFSQIFVPSLSRGSDLAGDTKVSFGINMQYKANNQVRTSNGSEAVDGLPAEVSEDKVPSNNEPEPSVTQPTPNY